MVFGGFGIMLYGGDSPLLAWDKVMDKVDVQSMFFATMFMIIILVLAYLTNPSETSFRTYLTEQSFRQHLSRLEDSNQDDQSDSDDSGVHFTLSRSRQTLQKGTSSYDSTPPFRFTSRATVSLRTPKHVFYSFGIMTIAAVLPTGRSGSKGRSSDCSGFMVSESWFIGAFGKWWRGGPIQSWWIDTVANNKDTERCSSGILDMKAFDGLECYEGISMNQPGQLPPASRDSPQKFRSTERTVQRTTSNSHRSTTPPPLPKSASLPLHIQRTPTDKTHSQRHSQAPSQPPVTPAPTPSAVLNPPQLNPSPSTLFDQSPVISEILRQISATKATVYDLRTQLSDFRAQAQESHAAIQSDLDSHRARKREEDAARQELKQRTKTLEDSKRSAESCRRDAEKRLRAAESARNSASERIERLDKEIGALKERMGKDEEAIVSSKVEADEAEEGLLEELEKKKKEIKVAEDVVAALNSRTKELEEKIAAEEERVKRAKEQAELRKQDRDFYPLHVVNPQEAASTWSPIVPPPQPMAHDVHEQINTDGTAQIEVFPTALQFPTMPIRRLSTSEEPQGFSTSPRPRHLSLGGISNFRERNGINIQEPARPQIVLRPPVHDDLPTSKSSSQSQSTRFSPFTDNELDVPAFDNQGLGVSPRSTSLIPTSLIQSLDSGGPSEDLSRSFQSDNDAILDRDWRKMHPFPGAAVENPAVFNSSPTSLTCPSFDGIDHEDPFEIRPPPPPIRHRIISDGANSVRAFNNVRTTSEPQPLSRSRTRESDEGEKTVGHRRWFSNPRDAKDKKGLNPEAKVFQFKKTFPMFGGGAAKHAPYDGLASEPSSFASSLSVPSIFAPSTDSDSAFSTLSMRAFAPSPAEREALARGVSTNTSLERLPTLSEIGSMPPSPSHVHALAAAPQHSPPHLADHGAGARSLLAPGFAWLHALPRMKKPKFSPWDDEADVEGDAR